eukprot:8058951-Alexandrium_andersonii.AAC.1
MSARVVERTDSGASSRLSCRGLARNEKDHLARFLRFGTSLFLRRWCSDVWGVDVSDQALFV